MVAAVAEARPDVVVHQLTALGDLKFPRNLDRAFAATNRLRTEGTENLLAAALAAGARRIVAQSFAGWPAVRSGGPVKTEADPFDPDPVPSMRARWTRSSAARSSSREPRGSRASRSATAASTAPAPA